MRRSNRRSTRGALLLYLMLGTLLNAAVAAAQEDATGASEDASSAFETDDAVRQGLSELDQLLAEDEEVLSGYEAAATYDPGTRRDPFRSLVQRVTQNRFVDADRPEGIAGLLIDEIEIEGIFITKEGPVAQVQASSDQTSHLLRPGDQLWDGNVVDITLNEIIFKQVINDPGALKPFREVVKRLNP